MSRSTFPLCAFMSCAGTYDMTDLWDPGRTSDAARPRAVAFSDPVNDRNDGDPAAARPSRGTDDDHRPRGCGLEALRPGGGCPAVDSTALAAQLELRVEEHLARLRPGVAPPVRYISKPIGLVTSESSLTVEGDGRLGLSEPYPFPSDAARFMDGGGTAPREGDVVAAAGETAHQDTEIVEGGYMAAESVEVEIVESESVGSWCSTTGTRSSPNVISSRCEAADTRKTGWKRKVWQMLLRRVLLRKQKRHYAYKAMRSS
jgi:hypothetical protein